MTNENSVPRRGPTGGWRRPPAGTLSWLCLAALLLAVVPAAAQPVVDGALDPLYLQKGFATDYVTNIPGITARFHQLDNPAIDPNFIYLVWEIGLGFVDNSYGTRRHSSWTAGHSFFDLAESDQQRLQLINVCGQDVVDATMDYIDGPVGGGPAYGTPSRYDVNMNATESVRNFINGGDWTKFAYKTSIIYNLNSLGFCSGGACNASPPGDGTNLLVDSPPWANQPGYIPAAPYGAWEYRALYEMRIDRTVFQTAQCAQGTPAAVGADPVELHASPAKTPDKKLILFRVSSSIGDYVWFDRDRDGIQDAGEPGIANVTVALYTDPNGDGDFSDGALRATTTTDSQGRYIFTQLGAGKYVVDVTDTNNVLAGFSLTVGPQSETDPSAPIVLPLQDENLKIDFGYAPTDTATAVVGDYVWSDFNQNGLQDRAEPGIGRVTLDLVGPGPDGLFGTADDVVVASTITRADGRYLFTGVAPGEYQVNVTDLNMVLNGYTLTVGPQSDTDPSTSFFVNAGDAYLNADFGYFRPGLGAIGNLVWFDVNEDRDFDAGEPGFGNVTLALINDANGDRIWDPDGLDNLPGSPDDEMIIASTITGIPGSYLFSGLSLNDGDGDFDYLVIVTDTRQILGGFLPSIFLPLTTTADNTGKFKPYAVALSAGLPVNNTADFGFHLDNPQGLIGDRVWYDADGDGVQDAGEPGIEDVELLLYYDDNKNGLIDNKKDVLLSNRTTDTNGNYFFPRLDFDANGEGYIVVISARNFGIINGRVDINADGVVDGADDGSLNGVTVIDGRLDVNGSGTITAADDGLWGGASVIDGVLDLDGDGVAGETNGHDSASGALATYKQTGDRDEAGTCVICDGKTASVLSNGFTIDLTRDFGYQSIGTFFIGDTVYHDLDADAMQDAGEPGLAAVVIGLYEDRDGDGVIDVDEPLVATDSTDANGEYLFERLLAGDYIVAVLDDLGILVGYTQTEGDPTEPVTVGPSTLDVDFGFVRTLPASISNFVWEDIDGDGLQDAGEPGVRNVTVRLYRDADGDGVSEPGGDDGAAVATTTTDLSGLYSFVTSPGRYFVEVVAPPGYARTLADQGASDLTDSDPDIVLGVAAVTQLSSGESDPSWDAGVYRPVAIGDRVWFDVDGDGVQDVGEPGIGNVTLVLKDGGGTPLESAVTDLLGNYLFAPRPPGAYFVDIEETTVPAGLALSGGTDPSSTSSLLSGQAVFDKDFGYTDGGSAIIGDFVWSDADNDGVQDSGEAGIGGVTVELAGAGPDGVFGTGDDTSATTTTAADGSYLFAGLAAGRYKVDVTDTGGVLTGYALSVGPQSSIDPTAAITVAAGDVYLRADFGYFQAGLGTIGTHVWLDADDDGVRDAGEAGIGGVSVILVADVVDDGVWDPDGADDVPGTSDDERILATTLTAADGSYLFSGLTLDDGDGDADYLVIVTDTAKVLTGMSLTDGPVSGADDNSQVVPYAVSLDAGGPSDPTADFGYNRPGSIGDLVWSDADGDGLLDPGEAGIGGVTLELLDTATMTVIDTEITAGNGFYLFTLLLAGDYTARVAASNFAPGGALEGYAQTGDPDEPGTCAVCDHQSAATLAAGDSDLTRDFGYRNAALHDISGTVFHDVDRDGFHDDPPETGFPAVTMELWRDVDGNGILDPAVDELVAGTVTDGLGDYIFTGLPDDDYIVAVTDDDGTLEGYELTSGLDQIPVELAGADVFDVDFGYVRDAVVGSIGDTVWLDVDPDGAGPLPPNGLPDPNEIGISGVTLELYRDLDGDGVPEPGGDDGVALATTITDADGRYVFPDLAAGDYFVVVDESTLPGAPGDLLETTYPAGVDPSAVIPLADGENYDRADFGYLPAAGTAVIGDWVWHDVDADGLQDADEVGIAGVKIIVTGGTLPGPIEIFTAVDGLWLATALAPGDYQVNFDPATVPPAFNPTPTNTDLTYLVTVVAGDVFLHLDYGFTGGPAGTVGDLVWLDVNGDGDRDAGEPGIDGVTVNLIRDVDGDGVADPGEPILATNRTAAGGLYRFSGLPISDAGDGDAGDADYLVDVTDIDRLLVSLQRTSGTFQLNDHSQADPYAVRLTAAAASNLTGDFGYTAAGGRGSIGTLVFHDVDGDGFRDPAETGIQGVTIALWLDVDGDGVITTGIDNRVRSATTDVNGEYEFNALPLGKYVVDVTDTASVLAGFSHPLGTPGVDDNSQTDPYAVTLSSAAPENLTADFGYRAQPGPAYTISGTVFEDEDRDAVYLSEPEVQGATLLLYRDLDGDGRLDPEDPRIGSLQSDAVGFYRFTDLPAGDYIVAAVVGATFVDGYLQTTQTSTRGVQPVTLPDPADPVDPPNSTGNDFGFWDGGITTTPVTLAYFHASGGGSVTFEWSTATETGNVGFNLIALTGTGARQINRELIPAAGGDSLEPRHYRFEASGVAAESFLLEDVDVFGALRHHGPFDLEVRHGHRPEPAAAIDWAAIRGRSAEAREARARGRDAELRRRPRPGRYPEALLRVSQAGIHRVTYEQLRAAGVDLAEAPLADLALESGGRPMPMRVEGAGRFGPGAFIEFIGEPLDTLYTRTNVYRLVVDRDRALRVDVDEGVVRPWAAPAPFFRASHRVERDRAYQFASPIGDPWYDTRLLAFSRPVAAGFDLELPGYLPGAGPVELEIVLWGGSSVPRSPDHHLVVKVNGELVADEWFDGLTGRTLRLEVPEGLLSTGANRLVLELPHDTGAPFDLVHYDHYVVRYPRRFAAPDGRLRFTAAGESFRVDALPQPDAVVYRRSAAATQWIRKVRSTPTAAGHQIDFAGDRRAAEYFVATPSAVLTPEVERAPAPADLTSGEAELLVIAHPDFLSGVEPLVAARRGEGYSVRVANVEDVYARFAHGVFDPEAIRSYVALAREEMGTRFVLLVGGDTYDYFDTLGLGSVSFIPSLYAQTDPIVRFAPVDPLFGDVDRDGLPDVAVGRLPVRTVEELEQVVAKTLAYGEDSGAGRDAVLAADAYDLASGYSFTQASDQMRALLGTEWSVERAYVDELGLPGARAVLLAELNAGVALTSYFGHSGPTVWSFKGLFRTADAERLENAGRPTLVLQWGCWNTYHVAPRYDTLGHRLLLAGDRGAAAVLGAATLTEASSERKLGSLLFRQLAQPGLPVGEAVLRAKRELAARQPHLLDVLLGWTLLGDPTLTVRP